MGTKDINRALAAAIRETVEDMGLDKREYQPNGRLWGRAKRVLDAGAPITKAATLAVEAEAARREGMDVHAFMRKQTRVRKAPVTQVPEAFRVQAERVRKGEVMRDSRGRIVSRETQELVEFLTGASV